MIVTLLTDFGTRDSFVAAMKGVILSIAPGIQIVDVTHEVPPQEIDTAGFLLSTVYRDFPEGTVHLVVVDPGVGSPRRAIAARAAQRYFIGPDNGVLDWALGRAGGAEVRQIEVPQRAREAPSRTFHGRDLFAPVAAELAAGRPFEHIGPPVADWIRAPETAVDTLKSGGVRGAILHVDRFGNGITSFTREQVGEDAGRFVYVVGEGRVTEAREYFADGDETHPFVYWGSAGYLEIGVFGGSASDLLGFHRGSPVDAHPR